MMKGLPAGVVALVVGIVAGSIAWRQYRVARAKLNLDLFEKRYELFVAVWAFASTVVQSGPLAIRSAERINMLNAVPKIEFLFGRELAAYVRTLGENNAMLLVIGTAAQANAGVVRPQDVEQHNVLTRWFANEATEGVRQRFGKYLDFEDWH